LFGYIHSAVSMPSCFKDGALLECVLDVLLLIGDLGYQKILAVFVLLTCGLRSQLRFLRLVLWILALIERTRFILVFALQRELSEQSLLACFQASHLIFVQSNRNL